MPPADDVCRDRVVRRQTGGRRGVRRRTTRQEWGRDFGVGVVAAAAGGLAAAIAAISYLVKFQSVKAESKKVGQ